MSTAGLSTAVKAAVLAEALPWDVVDIVFDFCTDASNYREAPEADVDELAEK